MTVLQRAEASEIILWSESVNRADVHRSQRAKFMGPANYVFFYFLLLIDLFIFLEKKKKKTTSLSALVTQLQPHENAGAVHDAVVLKY